MDVLTKEMINYGVLGIVVVALATIIGWAGLWARKVVEQVVSSYMANDKKRADAAESVAKTQEHLGDLVGKIDHTLGQHGKAHVTTLSALQEIVPPTSPVHREISEVKGRLNS